MTNRLDDGFIQADSTNLPKIDAFMVCEYVKDNKNFNAAEIRNAKLAMSSRESYGDQAIGFVCLNRISSDICIVKCKICPEHRIHKKEYVVILTVDEVKEKVVDVHCQDCAASSESCKHVIAFLMWIHRKSENPSPTEVECYWHRSVLSSLRTTKKFITLSELCGPNAIQPSTTNNSSFLKEVIEKAKELQLDSQLSRYHFESKTEEMTCLSLHKIMFHFLRAGYDSIDEFLNYYCEIMTNDLCQTVENNTRFQNDSFIWHELRYGRITASKLYEAAYCKTKDGTQCSKLLEHPNFFKPKSCSEENL